jgi:hypothetical protein
LPMMAVIVKGEFETPGRGQAAGFRDVVSAEEEVRCTQW